VLQLELLERADNAGKWDAYPVLAFLLEQEVSSVGAEQQPGMGAGALDRFCRRHHYTTTGVAPDVVPRTDRPPDTRGGNLEHVLRGDWVRLFKLRLDGTAEALAVFQSDATCSGAVDVQTQRPDAATSAEHEFDELEAFGLDNGAQQFRELLLESRARPVLQAASAPRPETWPKTWLLAARQPTPSNKKRWDRPTFPMDCQGGNPYPAQTSAYSS